MTTSNFQKYAKRALLVVPVMCFLLLCCLYLVINAPVKTPVESTVAIETTSTSTETIPTDTPLPINTLIPSETPDLYFLLYEVKDYIFDENRGAASGVKVYLGELKTFVFEIIGGGNCSLMPSGQGYLVRYPEGNEEWKDRQFMEESPNLFVLQNDIAIYIPKWVKASCP